MLSLIAVIGRNRELGRANKLLWHIPGDLPRFKKLTMGHPVIMGRKTFESIGKPLHGRTNIVITSKPSIPGIGGTLIPGIKTSQDGPLAVHSVDEAIAQAQVAPGHEEIFVIGGGKVFAETIDRADRLYLTIVDATADADTFFPDYSQFTKVISETSQQAGGFRFAYLTLERG